MRIQALKMAGRNWIPLILMATTNGEAEALLLFLLLSRRSEELYGTSMPRKKTSTT